jgi:ABC-type multidrug transport system permease subunit
MSVEAPGLFSSFFSFLLFYSICCEIWRKHVIASPVSVRWDEGIHYLFFAMHQGVERKDLRN